MISRIVFSILFATVTRTFAEHLRWNSGQAHHETTLSTEAADLRANNLEQAFVSESRKFISFFKGMVSNEPKEKKEAEDIYEVSDFKEFAVMNGAEIFISFLLWLILYLCVAAYYHKHVLSYEPPQTKEAEDDSTFKTFRSGLCGCTEDPGICFWAFVCPGIRWADSMSKVSIQRFWPAFMIITGLMCLSWIPVCTVFCHIIVCCYFTYGRQEFRKAFNFEEQGNGVLPKDCCTYFWCACCAIAQEGRHVRDACVHNHPAIREGEGCK